MERKIKFRAWDGNTMYTQNYCVFSFGNSDNAKPYWSCHYNSQNGGHFACDSQTKGVIIMQYTGLIDRLGREIYEGDIVKFNRFTQVISHNLGVIEGDDTSTIIISIEPYGVFYTDIKNKEDKGYLIMADGIHEESFEIIGNIYENIEL